MKRFLILMLTFALLSCSRDNNVNNCNFLLDVNVSAAINLNLPQFSSLQVTGSVVKLEGQGNAEWVLMDYVNVVVHIFQKQVRDFYDIESLWGDAKITEINPV